VLDAAIFGSQPDNGAIPQGILNGVTPITATAGAGINALTGDIKALMSALAAAGAGRGTVFVAGPAQVASMKIMLGPKWDYPLLASQALAATNSLIALEAGSFVSGFFFAPEYVITDATALHEEDTTPGNISGSTPVRSLFQTDALALKMTLRAAFGMRAQGHAQVVNGCTW
jgi:hypothetical protein